MIKDTSTVRMRTEEFHTVDEYDEVDAPNIIILFMIEVIMREMLMPMIIIIQIKVMMFEFQTH